MSEQILGYSNCHIVPLADMDGHSDVAGVMNCTGGHPTVTGSVQRNWLTYQGQQWQGQVLWTLRTQDDVLHQNSWTPTELGCNLWFYEACI